MNFSASMQQPSYLCANFSQRRLQNYPLAKQLMRISVLIIVIFLCFLQMLWAAPSKAQSMATEKVSLGLERESLEQAIKKIEAQTTLRFFYRNADIKSLVSLNLVKQTRTVEQILTILLKDTFLSFRQIEHTILIEKNTKTNYQIKGRVVGTDRLPIALATVNIRMQDSKAIIASQLSDADGNFNLQAVQKGSYIIGISAAGMDSLTLSLTLADKNNIELEDIVLSMKINTLHEVAVVGKKAYVEQKIDRTVINVGSLIANVGANALEVLEKSPGVIVDANGNISFKGKAGVMVLVDGRQTYLSGSNLASYLKSLPASALDQIELMDNPPAKYDAGGNAGVINIKTKKSKANGFNGSLAVSYGQAHYGQTSESVNLNYRINKVNLFGNLSHSLNHTFRKLDLDRHYFKPDGSLKSIFAQTQYIKPKSNAFNLKLGMDYYSSPKTTWGMVFTGLYTPNTMDNPSVNYLFNQNAELANVVTSDNHSSGNFNNKGINLNYSHQFDSLGKAITFDADYLKYNSRTDQSFFSQTLSPDKAILGSSTITSNLPTDIDIYSVKTDYSHPLQGKANIEAGLKSSYVNTDNAANYFNVNNGVGQIDYNLSNQFLYRENINAAYLNFNKSFRRIAFQTGLRVENTNAKGHQLGNAIQPNSSFTKSYTNLFPTAYLSYKLDSSGSNLLILSYGKRIGRPYYQDLNPFVILSDPFTYSSGNPYLRPQFSHNYKLSYNYRSAFSASLYYFYINDLQNEVIRQQGDVFIDGTGNIGRATYFGASVNANLPLSKWWYFSSYLQVFNNRFKGDLFGNYLDQSSTFGEINLTNQFTLANGWSAELSGWYITKRAGGQFINFATGQLNAGLQKKVLQDKGALKLSVRDILNTYTADGLTNFIPNANSTFNNRFYQQSFTLGFSYHFGGNSNGKKRSTGSAEIEKGRIKNQ